ncbi:hypothetical protein ACFX13_005460 [Malus domestica]|uniref:Uncharacterized protein n=1 Tax=Malus domestica TaxID=3750 RepID=A0A498IUH0_MALDO|nr:hypothetical protein DVH24_014371 [Malus domestica]
MGAVSVGVAAALMAMDDQKAMALGPKGPLMEEFWDNVRRYGLYALTVSTGGGIFSFSQVLYAMVDVSDFSYGYGYINPCPWIPSM